MYVSRTQEEILKELQDKSETLESRIEGTFSNDVFATNAIEFQKFSLELEDLYNASFGDTALGEYLEMRAKEHGVIRRAATKAVGEVDVTGTGLIKAGAIFATENNVQFVAVSDTAIQSTGTVEIVAVEEGNIGNVPAGAINKIPLNIVGIQAVKNAEPTVDGYDEEDDETLRDRYLTIVQNPATSGNPNHYVQWALEVSGVGAASCVRCWNGRGTVLVVIVDAKLNPAEDELLERVRSHIESRRPIGAQVTVQSAEPIIVNISVTVLGTLDVDKFKSEVTIYLKKLINSRYIDYTASDTYDGIVNLSAGKVSRSAIGAIIENQVDYDYDSLKLNGIDADIDLTLSQIPQLGFLNLELKIKN